MAHVLIQQRNGSIVYFRCECGYPLAFFLAAQVERFDDAKWEAMNAMHKEHRACVGEQGGLHVRKPMLHPVMCPHH